MIQTLQPKVSLRKDINMSFSVVCSTRSTFSQPNYTYHRTLTKDSSNKQTAIMPAHRFLRLVMLAMLSTIVLANPAFNIPEGEGFGFELQTTTFADGTQEPKWVPSQALLDEQQARWENLFLRDPLTNKTIPNPGYDLPSTERKAFNPPNGAECREVFAHEWYVVQCCGGGPCEDCSFGLEEFRILDNKNSGHKFAVFDIPSKLWNLYK